MTLSSTAPVSAIVPCWRSGHTIRRALASIASQTVRPSEVLLIDDASGDGTLDTLHALAAEHPPGWVRVLTLERNAGPGGARNAGWDNATQPWLAFLDADDAWHPRKIELQLEWIRAHPDAVLCGHATALSPAEGTYPELPAQPRGWQVHFLSMLIANRFPTRSVMLKRELALRFGGKEVTEDYLLWLQVVLAGFPCYRLDSPLAVSFRAEFSPGGYSGQLWRHEKRELAAWRALHRQGHLGHITFAIAVVWSLSKCLRRFALTNIAPKGR